MKPQDLFTLKMIMVIHIARENTMRLLRICVEDEIKWKEFGWEGLNIDEILDDLTKEDEKYKLNK